MSLTELGISGGTHVPDGTMVSPLFVGEKPAAARGGAEDKKVRADIVTLHDREDTTLTYLEKGMDKAGNHAIETAEGSIDTAKKAFNLTAQYGLATGGMLLSSGFYKDDEQGADAKSENIWKNEAANVQYSTAATSPSEPSYKGEALAAARSMEHYFKAHNQIDTADKGLPGDGAADLLNALYGYTVVPPENGMQLAAPSFALAQPREQANAIGV